MTLEVKQFPNWTNMEPVPYLLGGVREITNQTEYGFGHHAITIFDRRLFATDVFEFVRNKDTGEYYVNDGKWVGKEEALIEEEK